MKKEKQIFEAALYLRLSKENLNEEIGQSDSIANQEVLLCAYVKKHPEIHIIRRFVSTIRLALTGWITLCWKL